MTPTRKTFCAGFLLMLLTLLTGIATAQNYNWDTDFYWNGDPSSPAPSQDPGRVGHITGSLTHISGSGPSSVYHAVLYLKLCSGNPNEWNNLNAQWPIISPFIILVTKYPNGDIEGLGFASGPTLTQSAGTYVIEFDVNGMNAGGAPICEIGIAGLFIDTTQLCPACIWFVESSQNRYYGIPTCRINTPPSVENLTAIPPTSDTPGTPVLISANVTDDVSVSSVVVNVTSPSGVIQVLPLSQVASPLGCCYYSATYAQTMEEGIYTVRCIATDNEGAVNDRAITQFQIGTVIATTTTTIITTTTTMVIIPPQPGDVNVTFRYYAYDAYGVHYCTLYSNITGIWSANMDDNAVENRTDNEFIYPDVANGVYMWNVLCRSVNGSYYWVGEYNRTFRVCSGCIECGIRCLRENWVYGTCRNATSGCLASESAPIGGWFCTNEAETCCCGNVLPPQFTTTTIQTTTSTTLIQASTTTTLGGTTTTIGGTTSTTSTTTTSTSSTTTSTTTTSTTVTTTTTNPNVQFNWASDFYWNGNPTQPAQIDPTKVARMTGVATPTAGGQSSAVYHVTLTMRRCSGDPSSWDNFNTDWPVVSQFILVQSQASDGSIISGCVASNPTLTQSADTYVMEFDVNGIYMVGASRLGFGIAGFFADTAQPCPACIWFMSSSSSANHGCT